jgi:hypothetical protein
MVSLETVDAKRHICRHSLPRVQTLRSTLSVAMMRRMVFFAVILLCSAAGNGVLGQSSKPPESQSTDTKIREAAFQLTLPGVWSAAPIEDPTRWNYSSKDGHQGLTVSIVGDLSKMNAEERSSTFHKVVAIRRGAETKLPGSGSIEVSVPTFGEANGVLAARYFGVDPARRRRFHCLLLGNSLTVTIFYYESLDLTEAETEARAKGIFNTISVPRRKKSVSP